MKWENFSTYKDIIKFKREQILTHVYIFTYSHVSQHRYYVNVDSFLYSSKSNWKLQKICM